MTDEEIIAHLLASGIAGPHRSHPREDNILKSSNLATGDPDATFGMPEVASATADEALAAVAAVTGARQPAEPYIDPVATIAGVRQAAAVLRKVCAAGGTILVATGHPQGLLRHHGRLVVALTAAGGSVVTPLDGVTVYQDRGRDRLLAYVGRVGALTDGANPLHTHLPGAMEAVLAAGHRPDLVVADHGFAGAAVAQGIATIAVMDTNDPALAVARARGRDLSIIPMDDNRRPDSYDVLAGLFERELLG